MKKKTSDKKKKKKNKQKKSNKKTNFTDSRIKVMVNFIIKRDGKKEPFYIEKIKKGIVEAALKTDMQEKEAGVLAGKISTAISESIKNANEVLAAELNARVFSALDAMAPDVAKAWKKYQ